jgi:pilus assembly protein CpaB
MKRSIVAAVAAVVLALVGCLAVLLYVSGTESRVLAGKQPVTVLVATKRIPTGTSVERIRSGGFVRTVPMPKASVPDDAMSSLGADLDKLVVGADVKPGQLLLRGQLTDATRVTGGIALPEGKIAVSVPMANWANAAVVGPGSFVAVFDTFTVLEGKGRTPAGDRLSFDHLLNQATRLLLPRVEVVAIGYPGQAPVTTTTNQTKKAETKSSKSDEDASKLIVTLAVNQDEAERLIHGALTGVLTMALLDDTSDVRPGLGIDNPSLFQ